MLQTVKSDKSPSSSEKLLRINLNFYYLHICIAYTVENKNLFTKFYKKEFFYLFITYNHVKLKVHFKYERELCFLTYIFITL